jgi:hypothetical protein
MKVQAHTASQLLGLIPPTLYQKLTDELAVDKWVPKMKAEYLFKLLVFGILQTDELSLRVLQEFSRTPALLGLAPDLFEPATYGAIRARLTKVKVEFLPVSITAWQRIFLYKLASPIASNAMTRRWWRPLPICSMP